MNPSAIYSKSGKGVQEAAGKTSHLSRPDRAVLSAIDGRATLADVAQKVGKTFDPSFEKLIESLDKGGFIREVSAGTPAAKPAGGAKPAAKATAPMDAASDLDFTAALTVPKGKASPPPQTPPRATPPPSKQSATIPPPPPPPSAAQKVQAEKSAKEQQDSFAKAREEAERKAQAERDRVKAEAEAKVRAETEAKLRSEAEAKAKADVEKKTAAEAEARANAAAAVKAAAEAKVRAEAEARKAREEAERARKEAEEKAERARKEAEEKARREQEELKRKLEEERKAREEAERRAREEAKRLEEERRKFEEERKAREEEKRREEEERTSRRIQEERERVERRKQEKEEEEREKEARRKAKERDEAPEEEEEEKPKAKAKAKKEKEPEAAKPSGGGFSDTLLADLDSFTTRDEQEQKDREENERKEKEAAAHRAREAEERRAKEEAERQEREEKERTKREEKERKAREEAELRERDEKEKQRLKDEEAKRKKEAEERERKAKQEETLVAKAERGPSAFEQDQALRSRRERELAAKPRHGAAADREKSGWGKPIAIILFLALLVGVGVAHIMPLDVEPYQSAATDALHRPVTIRSANLSLFTGLQVKLNDVAIGGTRIGDVRVFPEFDALTGPRKSFSRIEIEGLKIEQEAIGEALFARVKADNFRVGKVVFKKLELTGPLALPKPLEAELAFDAEGALAAGAVRGPEALHLKLTAKDKTIEYQLESSSFTVPFAPDVSLSSFKAKGSATQRGASVDEWDGETLGGRVTGTANVRWGDTWAVDGVMTARNITAAVFAPALLSEGKAEGSGKFSMRGADPGKLGRAARIDGSFTVTRGVLGSIDLSRGIQTQGKSATGRTQFSEMNGQGTYDRGAVSLRSIQLSAGQLNAGASVDIAQSGALSGRIVADVRIAAQQMRATLNLGGTLKEPQVKN